MNKRTQIIAALASRLQTIRRSNGYHTDIGARVYVWRVTKVNQESELPAINIKYATEPDAIDSEGLEGPKNVWNRRLPVEINVLVKGSSGISDAEAATDDIWKAIGADDTFGDLCDTRPVSERIDENIEEYKLTGAQLKLEFLYRMNFYGK